MSVQIIVIIAFITGCATVNINAPVTIGNGNNVTQNKNDNNTTNETHTIKKEWLDPQGAYYKKKEGNGKYIWFWASLAATIGGMAIHMHNDNQYQDSLAWSKMACSTDSMNIRCNDYKIQSLNINRNMNYSAIFTALSSVSFLISSGVVIF